MSKHMTPVMLTDGTGYSPTAGFLEVIILPGAIGFFGICTLFALRITSYITKK
jgi:hypothetical protein